MSEPGTGLMTFPDGTGENPPDGSLPMGPLMADVFARWDAAAVHYVVLRNGEALPAYTRYDVDVLVRPRHRRRTLEALRAAAATRGWTWIACIRKRHYTCVLLRSPGSGTRQYLPVDVFTGMEHRGRRFARCERLLALRQRSTGGVWVLPDGPAAAVALLKELLPHSKLKTNSRAAVQRGARGAGAAFAAVLTDVLPAQTARDLRDAAAAGHWDALQSMADQVRRRLGRSPWRPLRLIHAAFANLRNMLTLSPALFVAVIGPDGCGKTTVARGAAERLLKRPFKCCRYQRGRFGVLPRLRDLRSRVTGHPVAAGMAPGTAHAGMIPPLPAWKSCALATYYAMDLVLGRLALRRWRGQWALVIFDRYFLDYYFQHGHGRAPRIWLNLLSRFVPRPDLIVHVKRAAEAIYSAKPELTLDEIRRQQAAIESLLAGRPEAVTVDGDRGIEATVTELSALIEAAMLERLHVA